MKLKSYMEKIKKLAEKMHVETKANFMSVIVDSATAQTEPVVVGSWSNLFINFPVQYTPSSQPLTIGVISAFHHAAVQPQASSSVSGPPGNTASSSVSGPPGNTAFSSVSGPPGNAAFSSVSGPPGNAAFSSVSGPPGNAGGPVQTIPQPRTVELGAAVTLSQIARKICLPLLQTMYDCSLAQLKKTWTELSKLHWFPKDGSLYKSVHGSKILKYRSNLGKRGIIDWVQLVCARQDFDVLAFTGAMWKEWMQRSVGKADAFYLTCMVQALRRDFGGASSASSSRTSLAAPANEEAANEKRERAASIYSGPGSVSLHSGAASTTTLHPPASSHASDSFSVSSYLPSGHVAPHTNTHPPTATATHPMGIPEHPSSTSTNAAPPTVPETGGSVLTLSAASLATSPPRQMAVLTSVPDAGPVPVPGQDTETGMVDLTVAMQGPAGLAQPAAAKATTTEVLYLRCLSLCLSLSLPSNKNLILDPR
jgi:hypothetical protein